MTVKLREKEVSETLIKTEEENQSLGEDKIVVVALLQMDAPLWIMSTSRIIEDRAQGLGDNSVEKEVISKKDLKPVVKSEDKIVVLVE